MLLGISFLFLSLVGYCASADTSYRCHFENGFCSFLMNDKHNSVNWMKGRGISKYGSIGPRSDHTLGNGNGNYVYVDVSSAKGKQINLQTIILYRDYCVRFFYHMTGDDIGDLEAYTQSTDDQEHIRRYFYREKSQGFRWKQAAFHVATPKSPHPKPYRVIFAINRSAPSNSSGHIALDDIELTPGKCPENKDMTKEICSFDYCDCGYDALYSRSWERHSEGKYSSDSDSKPLADQTLGTAAGGYWFALKTNTSGSDEYKFLKSPTFEAPENSTGCLTLYYYMATKSKPTQFGSEEKTYRADLRVDVIDSEKGINGIVVKKMEETVDRQWTFIEEEIDLPTEFLIQFVAILNTSSPAVIAIDDVQLFPGHCP